MLEIQTIFETLSKSEVNKLKRYLRETQGNVKQASVITSLNPLTLKRAAEGLRLKSESAKVIRENLLNTL